MEGQGVRERRRLVVCVCVCVRARVHVHVCARVHVHVCVCHALEIAKAGLLQRTMAQIECMFCVTASSTTECALMYCVFCVHCPSQILERYTQLWSFITVCIVGWQGSVV